MIGERAARRYKAGGELASTGLRRPPLASFAHGAAGVAYYLFRRAGLGEEPQALADAAGWVAIAEREAGRPGAFVASSSRVFPNGRRSLASSLIFGEAGVWCVSALIGGSLRDPERVDRAVNRFGAIAEAAPGEPDAILGAASLLVGAAVLVEELPDPAVSLIPVGERLAARLTSAIVEHERTGSGSEFLGAAHGWAGNAHALLRWSKAAGLEPSPEVTALLERLRAARLPDGLWPRRADSSEIWPGWCHGSAGWVQLWTLSADVLGDRDLLELAEPPGEHAVAVREREGSGLCCGRAGEGFAALALYRSTGDDEWQAHARRIAEVSQGTPVSPYFPEDSLWRGDLGVSLLALEVEHPMRAAMPLYRGLA